MLRIYISNNWCNSKPIFGSHWNILTPSWMLVRGRCAVKYKYILLQLWPFCTNVRLITPLSLRSSPKTEVIISRYQREFFDVFFATTLTLTTCNTPSLSTTQVGEISIQFVVREDIFLFDTKNKSFCTGDIQPVISYWYKKLRFLYIERNINNLFL